YCRCRCVSGTIARSPLSRTNESNTNC
ncbi:hypothetical protein D046_1867B, partial [Vibrio parahaemolyticus V-223/04]